VRLGGLAARIAGGEVDAPLRGPLLVVFLQAVVEGGQASFLGLWALRELHASQSALGAAYTAVAIAGVVAGYLAGRLSDRSGRRGPMLLASAGLPVFGIAMGFVRGDELLGLALMVALGAAGGTLLTLNQALLTDVVPRNRHEHAFAAVRVVQNLGLVAGPLLAALFLTISWRALFVGTGAIAALAFLLAVRVVPVRAAATADAPAATPGAGALRQLAHDRTFIAVLLAGTLGMMVYIAYQALLPISLVESHGFAPRTWGLLLALNPIVVVLVQIRLSARVSAVSEITRIALGITAMATPFLLIGVSTAIPLVVLMLLIFVSGEMLWAPPSQALLVRIAPEAMRGAYIGAGSASITVAFALGPLLGLQLRSSLGDEAMWIGVAILGAVAIGLYAVAERYAGRDVSPS
jgi:MFS family permease